MNNKRGMMGWAVLFLFVGLLVFTWAFYKGYIFAPALDTGNNTAIENETDFCPQCQDFPDIDKLAYYFDNQTYQGLNVFMDNSERFLYCAFTKLEDRDYASRFLALKNVDKDVKIHFGVDGTMKDCEVSCVPKLNSQYNYLLAEGVDVSYSRLNFNFCVNERAVYIFSLLPNDINKNDNGLIIFNPQLRQVYQDYFSKIAN